MLCDVCQNNQATVYLTQIVEGSMQKVNLCESCAQEKGVTDPTGFALADLLKGLGTQVGTPPPSSAEGLACPVCAFTQRDFKKTGRFGCSECYDVFYEGLDNLLEAMHRHTEHHGKVPSSFAAEQITISRLNDLRESLTASVAAEDYEEAARLRDEISQLENQFSEEKEAGLE